jgi:transcriptional regulator with XRE-family HTH domain
MNKNGRERIDKSIRQQEFGAFVQELRKSHFLRISDVAKFIGVSTNFISLLERGKKPPSDHVIRGYSKLFGIDEIELYDIIDKLPPHIKNMLEEHDGFKRLVIELMTTVKEPELRQKLYEEIFEVYIDFLKRHGLFKEGDTLEK